MKFNTWIVLGSLSGLILGCGGGGGSKSAPANTPVPNVVGVTQATATSSLTTAGLTLGTVTSTPSATVPSGTVISESPAAGAMVAAGATVNLVLSSGKGIFAYVTNTGDGTLSAYSMSSADGTLSKLSPASVSVAPGGSAQAAQMSGIAIDPSNKYLFVLGYYKDPVSGSLQGIYSGAIGGDGSLTGLPVIPVGDNAGTTESSLIFDSTGAYLYTLGDNGEGSVVYGFSMDASTGELSPLANSPYSIVGATQPMQMIRVGKYLYLADGFSNSVDVFTITANGELIQGVLGSPFSTGSTPAGLVADPTGSVLYVSTRTNSGTNEVVAFTIDSSTGILTPVAGNPQLVSASYGMAIDPQGKFLLTNATGGVQVFAIGASGIIGAPVAGSPFATSSDQSAANAFSVTFDPTGKFVYVCNEGSVSLTGVASGTSAGSVAAFAFNPSTGALTPVAGSPVTAGANPDFIAIQTNN